MSQTIAGLSIDVTVSLAKMQTQLDTMNKRISSAAARSNSSFKSLATQANRYLSMIGIGFSAGMLSGFAREIASFSSEIVDASARAGIGTTEFQKLALVAGDCGVNMDQLATALALMRKNLSEAYSGSKPMQDALKALKLDAATLISLAPEKQFEAIAKAIASASDSAAAYAAAADILGAKNLPKLNAVLATVAKSGYEVNKAFLISPEVLKRVDDIGDRLTRIWTATKGIASTVIAYQSSLWNFGFVGMLRERGLSEELESAGKGIDSFFGDVDKRAAQIVAEREANVRSLAESSARAEQERADAAKTALDISDLQSRVAKGLDADQAAYNAQLDAYAVAVRDSLDPTREFVRDQEKLSELFDSNKLTLDEYADAMERLDKQKVDSALNSFFGDLDERAKELQGSTKDVKSVAKELGLTFTSAFEDAIVDGGKLSDVLKGLYKDILRILIRQTVTEQGAAWISALFSSWGFGGGMASGGTAYAGKTYLVGEEGPELFSPPTSGRISTAAQTSAMLGGSGGGGGVIVNINQTFEAGVSKAELAEILPRVAAATRASVFDEMRRRGMR